MTLRFVILSACVVVLAVLAVVANHFPPATAQNSVPPVSNIQICDGPNPGEVIVAWDAVPEATHYRIGYVNMETDYPLAKASATGDWINAFIYVDEDARNVRVSTGRAEYTVRRLAQGVRHAITVLTSDNFVDTGGGGSVSSTFFWPSNPRWEFHTVGANQGAACPTAAPEPDPTPTPTQIPSRAYLYEPIQPPMAPAYMDWRWESDQAPFRELITDFTIHNDVGDWSDQHGYYLILIQNSISNAGFYFGLQTNVQGRGKGAIFSRWGTRDLANARYSSTDGWTQSSGHEGDFIGVRRSYDWGEGNYRIRIAPDGLESDGEWFGLWITDLDTNITTWIGSLKFPLLNGTATIRPYSSATIELYGNPLIRPIDIPQWHVSVKRPLGDNVPSTHGSTSYPFDDSENALPNSDVRYDPQEEVAHLWIGGTTERQTPAGNFQFRIVPAPTQIPGRSDLYEPVSPPIHVTYIHWHWEPGQAHFRELTTDFTIHNDVGDWSDQHGLYLMLTNSTISDTLFYFGLQTDVQGRGKGAIFSRWETRDLANARYDETDGWIQSSGHEGDFIGVRRTYDWGKGNYRIRIAPDGLESDGEWFSLWITNLHTHGTTWIGSLKFPLLNGAAKIEPWSYSTIEIYGNLPIQPIDIPQWHVSVKRPMGDNLPSTHGQTGYSYSPIAGDAVQNSDIGYDPSEDVVHIRAGGTTERANSSAGRIDFR